MDRLLTLLASVAAVVFVFAPHEFAHAYIAYKNGDPTAAVRGRKTLNPLKHIEPTGFVLFALTGFGWAKPVPVDPYNFKNYKRGMFTTAIAGVIVNYIVAFLAYLIFMLLARFLAPVMVYGVRAVQYLYVFIESVFYLTFLYSLYSVVFNLLPLYPLDGFRVLEAFTRQINPVQRFLRNYGQMILIILVAESFTCGLIIDYVQNAQVVKIVHYCDLLGYLGWFAERIIGFPITAAWGWIAKI